MSIADHSGSAVLRAMAAQATGAALLASGRTSDAMVQLRAARTRWQRLAMPYETARSAVLVGRGCAVSGDSASAALEFGTARAIFESLGAGPDLRQACRLAEGHVGSGPLSVRELEVLGLVAEGHTSREIASSLGISRHTVRRHLENTFAKLGVKSRAAAVAYAYEHDLL
jgi:DNA-binding CsgD family transcriptional regulator